MSSRERENVKSKFKAWLPKNTKLPVTSIDEIELDLRPEQPAANRCKTLKDLGDSQLHHMNLEETSITRLWDLTKDLIVPNKPAEYRQTALVFYAKLIYTQYKNLTLMREHFFLVLIQNHDVPDDLKYRLDLLDTLTENGKDIKNFEERIGKFMLHWIPAITEANLLSRFLDILVNLIKFNAAHLDEHIVVGIIQDACHLCCTIDDDGIGLQCLTILELVMSYTIFPTDPLPQYVVTLCRTVNHIPYVQSSWKIMKNLLGTQLGYYSMKMMCNILNDHLLYEDQQLLRGAVFHLNMNIFGSDVVFQVSPMFYASAVLTSFLNALNSRQVIVTFEVILSVRKVISKYKVELSEIIWDRLCDIMSAIQDNIEYYETTNMNKERLQSVRKSFHENIDSIEKLVQDEKSHILANIDRIYDLIERVSESRSEASVFNLIQYRSKKITATRPEWLQLLNNFLNRFYSIPNTRIRIKTIQALVQIMDLNRVCYEEEILERVVIPTFGQITQENDLQIRIAVVKALVGFARHCDTKRCGELLEILEKVINRQFEQCNNNSNTNDNNNVVISSDIIPVKNEAEILDIIEAVDGLIELFACKLHRLPSNHAIKIFNILVGHLELHYEKPKIFEHANIIRFKIFNSMLKARANASFHIGYPDASNNDIIKFSSYLGVDSSLPISGMSHLHNRHQIISQLVNNEIVPNAHFTTISIRRACKMIVKCLDCDRDYQIFQLVLKELPKVLKNKALIQGNDMEALATVLIKIRSDNYKPLLSYKPTSDEFHGLVLPAFAALVIYNQHIQTSFQYKIISAFNNCILSSNVSIVCIHAMTTMILEMPEVLMRTLPDFLLQMSKMSDTTMVALPVLEFLSILSRLSNHLFTNFIPRQYMYVFAICLPYTKPHRYDHYTVSLAHHVIAGWFLKCKLEFRKNFVSYIISSIQSNASMLYEDINNLSRTIQRQDFNSLNEDSSNRKRSTSLTERGSRNARTNNDSDMRPLMNDSLKSFHAELAETCIDFLARHTFSPCSPFPKRSPAIDYLLKDGISQTWLVGHNLVTITTSGCPSAPTRNGLCERCSQLCKVGNATLKNTNTPLSPDVGVQSSASSGSATAGINVSERRYTKVSLQHSSGNESAGSTDLTSSSSSTSAAPSTQRQTSNSSTASLEALSRRGSNPDEGGIGGGGIGTGSITSLLGNSSVSISASPTPFQLTQPQVCLRSCTGWAEIYIRRPTGNISWITRIQNPISMDCFGQDLPLNDMVSLFLPTEHGGVFGPEIDQTSTLLLEGLVTVPKMAENKCNDAPFANTTIDSNTLRESLLPTNLPEIKRRVVAKVLQRQEEISSVAASGTTAAIDIPKVMSKRNKDALSGSVSDGEADDDMLAFEDANSRSRNPVRRVNSSPEMSSSWQHKFLQAKPAPLSRETIRLSSMFSEDVMNESQTNHLHQQKKKSVQYTKDVRVSCDAIPEEIAGSTPPKVCTLPDAAIKTNDHETRMLDTITTLPPKQHSADDVSTSGNVNALTVQQSASSSSLKLHTSDKIMTKPPLSPAPPLSPRLDKHMAHKAFASHQGLAKSSSSGGTSGNSSNNNDYNNGDMMRGRSKTISVAREVNGKSRPSTASLRSIGGVGGNVTKQSNTAKLCMNPSFVFMQLYNTGIIQVTDTPIKVPTEMKKKISLLDFVPPCETHKIGVLYVGEGQCNNFVEILRNSHGSTRYIEFLRNIGTLVCLKDAKQNNLFVFMDTDGDDGKFTYIWKDDIMQVVFEVTTLMPTNLQKDPNCNGKIKHIGNDYVNIIYNESGEEYNLNTITGQFNYACVMVEPLELNTNRVYVKARPEISKFVCHPEPKIVSDRSAPLLARQMALHANLASHVYQSLQKKNPYASNWLERLRMIKRLRTSLIESQNQSGLSIGDHDERQTIDALKRQNTNRDFTKYT